MEPWELNEAGTVDWSVLPTLEWYGRGLACYLETLSWILLITQGAVLIRDLMGYSTLYL